jgi:hypothetical protein
VTARVGYCWSTGDDAHDDNDNDVMKTDRIAKAQICLVASTPVESMLVEERLDYLRASDMGCVCIYMDL